MKTSSVTSPLTLNWSCRAASKTFSILWVRLLMSVSPSMADSPLRLWAARNISLSRFSSQGCVVVVVERLDPLVQLQQLRR